MDAKMSVFISYRRDVSQYAAFALYEKLVADGYDVFMDVKSIGNGLFGSLILKQIETRTHFIVLLAPGSVFRCVHEDDWFRREIEHALATQRNIVPLIFEGFSFKKAEPFLVNELKQLKRFNAIRVYLEYFEEAVTRLERQFLDEPVSITISQPVCIPSSANQVAFELRNLKGQDSDLVVQRQRLKETLNDLKQEKQLSSEDTPQLGNVEREIERVKQQLRDLALYQLAVKMSSSLCFQANEDINN